MRRQEKCWVNPIFWALFLYTQLLVSLQDIWQHWTHLTDRAIPCHLWGRSIQLHLLWISSAFVATTPAVFSNHQLSCQINEPLYCPCSHDSSTGQNKQRPLSVLQRGLSRTCRIYMWPRHVSFCQPASDRCGDTSSALYIKNGKKKNNIENLTSLRGMWCSGKMSCTRYNQRRCVKWMVTWKENRKCVC